MKYSPKMKAPQLLEEWRDNPDDVNTDDIKFAQQPIKQAVREALLNEQGYVCCYCGVAIGDHQDAVGYHIEHFFPRRTEGDRSDYLNLYLSCGRNNTDEASKTCGNAKQDQLWGDHTLRPCVIGCEDRFRYSQSGLVEGRDEFATEAIQTLSLNQDSRRVDRQKILRAIEVDIDSDENFDIANEIHLQKTPDELGRLPSFGHVVAMYLRAEVSNQP